MTRDKQPRDNSVVGLDSRGVLQILNAMLIQYLNSLKLQKLKETTFYGDFGNWIQRLTKKKSKFYASEVRW